MSKVHKLIDVTTQGTDVTSDTIHCQHNYDEAGLYQVTTTAGTITNVFFYGRLGSDHDWATVATAGAQDASAGTVVASAALTIYPQMKVVLDVNSSPSCVISIME
jgi:hypothetical protein